MNVQKKEDCAVLKSDHQYTIFIFRNQVIRFVTSSKNIQVLKNGIMDTWS